MNSQPLLTDPLSNAKTVCHLCGKAHLHGPFDRDKQLRINREHRREHRWQRIKDALGYLPVPVIFFGVMTLGAISGPRSHPLTAEEEAEALADKHRIEQIDSQMEKLQAERDEIDPPQEFHDDWGR